MERSGFGAEHVGRHLFDVLAGLPHGVSDGVSLFGPELGGGQCASNVKDGGMVPRCLTAGRTATRERRTATPQLEMLPQPVAC